MIKRILIYIFAGIILIGSIYLFLINNSNVNSGVNINNKNLGINNKNSLFKIGDRDISLIIVSTSEDKERGLGGMESLKDDQAMLFVFDKPDKYGIWMKDMKFSIDIFWLDENMKIIHIEQKISPATYPDVLFPPENSLYVLETNAGFAEKNNISVGKVLNFPQK